MKPKLEKYCLLCSGACSSADKGCQLSGGGGGDGDDFGVGCDLNCGGSLKQQLRNMFILLKLLDVPKNWCEGILRGDDEEMGGGGSNPDSWFTLCANCEETVDKAWTAYREMIKWATRLNLIKVQIKENMRRGIEKGNSVQKRFYSDDGIEVVNFEVGKLLFPDLFQGIKQEVVDFEEESFSDDFDEDRRPMPTNDTMQGYLDLGSGTKGAASLSVENGEGPAAGTQIKISGGVGAITRGRGRPLKLKDTTLNGPPIKVKEVREEPSPSPPSQRPSRTPKLRGGQGRPRGRGRPKKLNLEREKVERPRISKAALLKKRAVRRRGKFEFGSPILFVSPRRRLRGRPRIKMVPKRLST